MIANAVSYSNLLFRHIEKEDNTVFPFAERSLKSETLHQINTECENFEKINQEQQIQKKYISLLEVLEAKYLLI